MPLLALDASFVVLALLHRLGVVDSRAFALGQDSGVAELAQYAKEVVALSVAVALYRRWRQPVYLAVAALLAALLVDDVTRFHEVGGEAIAAALGLPALPGLRPQDLGEIVALATWAVPLVGLGAWAYRESGPAARRHARWFGAAVVALAGFGVAVDLVHQAFSTVWGLSFALEVAEEGGELATMSVIVAGAVALWRRPAADEPAAP